MGENYISIDDLESLKIGFKTYLNNQYSHLGYKSTIVSDAFYIFKINLEMSPQQILFTETGIDIYKPKLEKHFKTIGRKNPKSDASTYCRAIKYLREYVNNTGDSITMSSLTDNIQKKCRKRKSERRVDIPTPCETEIIRYLNLWDTLENYTLQEKALDKLFFKIYPNNTVIEDILVKVSTLNDFYSTNIFDVYNVAKHILKLDIDNQLNSGDLSLVNKIAETQITEEKIINFYSFASKYCSHHKPLDYPIYDNYVDKLLKYFRNVDSFSSFKYEDVKEYKRFRAILEEFRIFYNLQQFNLKEIDKYLWQLGKEKFPKKYKRTKKA